MTIRYDAVQEDNRRGVKMSPALARISAINESFQAQGLNVLNEGFAEVATNTHFYSDYIQQLSEGMDEVAAEQFEVLAENTRREILAESTIGGITPITALSLPMLRVAFAKTAVREGLPTEPVTQPKFTVSWLKPYIVDPSNGEKVYLPKALKTNASLFGLPKLTPTVALTNGQVVSYDLLTGLTGASHYPNGDEIDVNFKIVSVTVAVGTAAAAHTDVVVPVNLRLETLTNVIDGTITAVSGGETTSLRLFAKVDREHCTMDVVSVMLSQTTTANADSYIKSIEIQGYLSSEMNNRATQVGFDITQDPTVIGTGQPIESPINIQQMTDAMAMYNVDSTVRHLEIMSTTLAQSTDLTGVNFIANAFDALPATTKTALTQQFDITPPSNYALGNTAWREEIKLKIDKLVIKMMNETNYTSGSVVIFGNPLDVQVLNNVRWTYSADEQPNGANIDYRLGTYTSGVTTYKVLSSFNFQPGSLYMVFLPNVPDQKTCVYYPYSFNVIRGSQSPSTPNLPSIQMIKRQIFREYTPMIAKLNIIES